MRIANPPGLDASVMLCLAVIIILASLIGAGIGALVCLLLDL